MINIVILEIYFYNNHPIDTILIIKSFDLSSKLRILLLNIGFLINTSKKYINKGSMATSIE